MKKFVTAFLAFLLCASALAQVTQFSSFYRQNYTAVLTDVGVSTIGSGTSFYRISWNAVNAPATCTFTVDSSANNSAWTTGGVLASQPCTSSGSSAVISLTTNYFRVNITAISGASAAVTVVVMGYTSNAISTPQPYFAVATGTTGTAIPFTQNLNTLKAIVIPAGGVQTTGVLYNVNTADATANTYDLGILNSNGTIVVNLGATAGTVFAATTGNKTANWVQGSTFLPAGKYYIAYTTNCATTCAALAGGGGYPMAFSGTSGATAGGAIASTTAPADSFTTAVMPMITLK